MKKMKRAVSFVLIVLTAIAGFTCKQYVGLGGQIDVLPPSGEISLPDAGETPIRGSFVLKGTASDDDGIQSISVVFKNIDTREKSQTYKFEDFSKGSASVSWTINVKNESTGTVPGHKLVKLYPIPDGEYTAILSVTDMGGKTSEFTKNYKIDNTPPVFIVSRPSTVADVTDTTNQQADGYGATFSVIGQAEDKNKIENLTLKVKDSNISISKQFVGKNINEEIATASADSVGNYTDPLYRYNAEHTNPKIKAHISLTDNARFFTSSGEQGPGNTSEWYYLRDKNIRSVLEKGYTADIINDYFAGKKGAAGSANKTDRLLAALYDENNPEGQAVKHILEDSRIMTESEVKFSIFTLDPNKSPGFKAINAESIPLTLPADTPDADLPHPSVQFFGTDSPPTIFIDLIANRTNEPLVENYNYNAYKESRIVVNLYKCNEVAYTTNGSNKILNVESSVTPAHSLKFENLTTQDELDNVVALTGDNKLTIKWKLPNDFAEGNYVLRVEGKDTHGNEFIAYDKNNAAGGTYVIKFQTAGDTPIIVPRAPSGYIKESFHIKAYVSSLGEGAVVRYKLDGEAGEHDTALTNTAGTTEWKTTAVIPLTSIGDGTHSIHFWAKDTVKEAVTGKIEFIVDRKAPDAELTYPPVDAAQAGTVTIMGSVSDDYAGVKAEGTKYIIGKKTPAPTVDSSDWKKMDKSSPVSWHFMYNLDDFSSTIATDGNPVAGESGIYDIPVYILTEDKIGNKKVTEKSVRFDSDGDKPVITILSPQQDQTLGGTIQIFGTATTRINGPADVGKVYIQFSKNGNFEDTTNDNMIFGSSAADYDADWHKGGSGQLLPKTDEPSGGANWQLSINGNGAFNNPNGDKWEVYFRLRAENKASHKYGPWSRPVKISIDKAYPTIGSPVPLKLVNADGSSGEEKYVSDMWIPDGKKLTGSLFDDSGIKAITISSPELLGNQTYSLSDAVAHNWIAEDSTHAPNPATGAKNYMLQIPLTLSTLSDAVKRKGEITIKIRIVENTPKELTFENTVKFRFDIIPPSGALGDFIYRYGGEVRAASIVDDVLAQKVKSYAPGSTPNYSTLHLLINGKIVKITDVTGTTVHFEPALERAGTYNCLLYKEPFVISNESGKWIVRGVANDDGSGVAKVEATVTVGGQTAQSGEIKGQKITKQLGGQVSWEGEINLSALKDGKGKLSCKIYDERGIMYEVSPVDVIVKNKPIKVSKVTLMTDIAGAPESFENNATNKALKNVEVDTNLDFTADFTSSEFAFKNKNNSKIKVDFTGGYGTVKYQLKKGDGTKLGGLTTITSGGEIDLKDHLNEIGNSDGTPKKIILELWGEAADFTQGVDSAFAKINITTLFDALDDKAPTVVILPFHWNGEGDNSLYQNSRANGHVEIDSSSVSGKVIIRGFAYDNIKLDKIEATFKDASSLNVTATRTGNTWASNKTMAVNDAELKVTHLGADYLGYYVKWELSFDSSKIPLGAAKDIKVIANDGGRNSVESEGTGIPATFNTVTRGADNSASHADFASAKAGQFVVFRTGEKQYFTRISKKNTNTEVTLANSVPTEMKEVAVYDYTANKTKTAVKSVPYITAIKRPDTYNTNRSSSGAYNLLRGDTVTVEGFNLTGTVKATVQGAAEETLSGSTFTLSTNAKSGKVKITVDGVEAINNSTNNGKPYNRQELANRPETQYWTDDLTIDVWKDDEDFAGSNNPKYPSMAMGSNGDLYAAYSNYSDSKVYYSKLGDAPQSVYWGYDPPEEAAISVSGTDTVNILYSANYHGGLPAHWIANITRAGGLYCYDTHAPNFLFFNDNGGKIYRFELFYHQKQLQQFKNFRIARKNNNIHIAYYDTMAASVKYSTVQSGTTNADINFHNGQYDMADDKNNRSEIAWVDLDGSTLTDLVTDPNLKRVGTVVKLVDGSSGQFEGSLTRTGSTAEYCALALDGSNRPVVVYADVDTGTLRLARANAETPTAATNWKVQKVLPAGDANTGRATDYFAAQFDSAGYLHIVFRNTKGQICYVKSTNANAGASAYTFEKSVVIAENGSRVELTMEGTTPYVAYLSKTNAYDGIQIAYYDTGLVKTWKSDGSADQTGAWNVMTAAMKQRASDARACIAVAPNNTLSWKAAVGYTPGNVYRVVKYIGK